MGMRAWWRAAIAAGLVTGSPSVAQQAAPVAPHATVALPAATLDIEFHASGDMAVLTARLPDGRVTPVRAVAAVGDALSILADRRLAPLWPALLAWSGDDLVLLRDRALARSRFAAEVGTIAAPPNGQTERWSGDPALSATLHYATGLIDSGQFDAGLATLRRSIEAVPAGAGNAYRRVFLTIRLANALFDHNRTAEGIAVLDHARVDPATDGDFKINLDVNLAMLLARSGEGTRSLALIDAAWHRFDGDADAEEAGGHIKVPSSEANFAWIKACALHRLGREPEARALIDGIVREPGDYETAVTARARLSGFLCLGDAHALAGEFAELLAVAAPGDAVFAAMQPGATRYRPEAATLAAAARDPLLATTLATRARLLSPRFDAALAGWPATQAAPAG